MFLQRHKIKENWNPEFLSSCEAEEFNNFQSIIVKDKQDFNKRKYLAFEKTWKLLSTMDCPVFVTGGTLLGIIRDNKFIIPNRSISFTALNSFFSYKVDTNNKNYKVMTW